MADNIAVTPGTGKTVIADEVVDGTLGTGIVQYVKIMDGTLDGTTKATVGANGLEVNVKASALPSGAATAAKQPALGTAGSASSDVITIQGVASMTKLLVTPDLPSGASTAAKQPALGTAGSASTDVLSVQGIASMTALKVDGSAVTQPVSGTVTANAGSGTMAVSNAGTFATQSAITVAAGATSIAENEDVASADGDRGVKVLAVRKATPANTSGTDGDYEMLQMSAGRMWVDASGKTLTVDGSGVTQPVSGTFWQATQPVSGTVAATQSGTWTVQPGNTANTTAWKVDASSVAVPVTDNSGSLTVDNGGTFAVQSTIAAGATNIAKAEDVASADADVGVPAMAIRKATPANTSGTDGDYEMLQVSAGRLWTSAVIDTALPAGTNGIGKLTANSGVTIGAVEVAASQTLATVTTVSTLTNQTQEGGVNISLNAGAVDTGTRRVVQANGAGKTIVSKTGSASSSGNNTLVAAGTNKLKVFAFSLVTASATSITCKFQDGASGTDLWSVILQAPASVTTGANLAVSPPAWLFNTSSATLLNLNLSSANAVQWSVSYYDEA